jgi:hypothetical protein
VLVKCYAFLFWVTCRLACAMLTFARCLLAPFQPLCTAFVSQTCIWLRQTTSLGLHEVPRVYFPQRPGNRVTLYHDSVCTPGPVPGISLASGGLYSESSCWDDVYAAIQQAKR